MLSIVIALGVAVIAVAMLAVYAALEARMYREAFELAKKSMESWRNAAHAWQAAVESQGRMVADLTKRIDAMTKQTQSQSPIGCPSCGHSTISHGEWGCNAVYCDCQNKYPV